MAVKFPEQRTIFVSCNRPKDLKSLSGLLVSKSPCPCALFITGYILETEQILHGNTHIYPS